MIIAVLAIIFILGTIQIVKDYTAMSITGGVVSGSFNAEEQSRAEIPEVAALLGTVDNKLFSDELNSISYKDEKNAIIKPTMIPARKGDHKFYIEWNQKLMVLSLYMKKEGSEDSSFEIWVHNKRIASGELTNEFKWYNFDVSSSDMSSEDYALFNYGGGTSDIIIDYVLGVPVPENGLTRVTGLISIK